MTPTELLGSIPAFASLAADDLVALADRLDEERVPAGRIVVREGETDSSALYLIEAGDVEVSHGEGHGHVALATLGPKQYFGELSLIDGAPRSATVTAKTDVHLLVLDRADFVDFIHRDPDAALRVMGDLAARLRHTNDLVAAATEDMHKMGGMEALDAPYATVSVWEMIRKRAGWLAVLFVGEMLTASAMGHFEDQIQRAVVLALFVPLIISSGGNSGAQGTSLIIRALALQELKLRDWFWVLRREILSGLALGMLLGVVGFARIVLWQYLGWADYGPNYMALALTVWLSLIGVVGFGATTGSMLPFILRRAGFDPATSSAPFVATLVDVTGLVIYFTVAALVLRDFAM